MPQGHGKNLSSSELTGGQVLDDALQSARALLAFSDQLQALSLINRETKSEGQHHHHQQQSPSSLSSAYANTSLSPDMCAKHLANALQLALHVADRHGIQLDRAVARRIRQRQMESFYCSELPPNFVRSRGGIWEEHNDFGDSAAAHRTIEGEDCRPQPQTTIPPPLPPIRQHRFVDPSSPSSAAATTATVTTTTSTTTNADGDPSPPPLTSHSLSVDISSMVEPLSTPSRGAAWETPFPGEEDEEEEGGGGEELASHFGKEDEVALTAVQLQQQQQQQEVLTPPQPQGTVAASCSSDALSKESSEAMLVLQSTGSSNQNNFFEGHHELLHQPQSTDSVRSSKEFAAPSLSPNTSGVQSLMDMHHADAAVATANVSLTPFLLSENPPTSPSDELSSQLVAVSSASFARAAPPSPPQALSSQSAAMGMSSSLMVSSRLMAATGKGVLTSLAASSLGEIPLLANASFQLTGGSFVAVSPLTPAMSANVRPPSPPAAAAAPAVLPATTAMTVLQSFTSSKCHVSSASDDDFGTGTMPPTSGSSSALPDSLQLPPAKREDSSPPPPSAAQRATVQPDGSRWTPTELDQQPAAVVPVVSAPHPRSSHHHMHTPPHTTVVVVVSDRAATNRSSSHSENDVDYDDEDDEGPPIPLTANSSSPTFVSSLSSTSVYQRGDGSLVSASTTTPCSPHMATAAEGGHRATAGATSSEVDSTGMPVSQDGSADAVDSLAALGFSSSCCSAPSSSSSLNQPQQDGQQQQQQQRLQVRAHSQSPSSLDPEEDKCSRRRQSDERSHTQREMRRENKPMVPVHYYALDLLVEVMQDKMK